MRFANIAIKRQHIAVFGGVTHLNVLNVDASKSLIRKHISVKDATRMLNMMQQLARLF